MQLSERYRPATFDALIGQDKALARVRAVLGLSSFDRGAFALVGPSGSGKTSLGMIVADHLGCRDMFDRVEIKGQDCTVDELRRISDWFRFIPPSGEYKTVIINECHLMSSAARSYALELMEAPPAKRVILLTTTEPDWCDETLFSRFYTIRLVKPHSDAITAHLRAVCEREGMEINGLNLKRFVQERHNNIRLCLNDLEIETAVGMAA